MWCFVLACVGGASAAAAADWDSLASLAELDFAAPAAPVGAADDPVPFLDMPAQFSSAILLSQTSDAWNQTFTGTIWGSSPTKQQRLSGTCVPDVEPLPPIAASLTLRSAICVLGSQVVTNGLQTVRQGVTYIEDGSIGMKYTYTPNPNAKDHSVPDVLCKSQAMSKTELARYDSYDSNIVAGPTQFAGNVFLDDRVTTAYVDPTVPAPAVAALFVDPFKNVAAGM